MQAEGSGCGPASEAAPGGKAEHAVEQTQFSYPIPNPGAITMETTQLILAWYFAQEHAVKTRSRFVGWTAMVLHVYLRLALKKTHVCPKSRPERSGRLESHAA
ncbi:hypothetical protein Ae201684P_019897 [Aphanomyces euteiches]|uniref:Uncharacterized protein n=1 Tax=Aphanomyces euteiches TaxID=100861 RepID=A0A6G0WCA4_9STRA|nr:hypothetical protein Ae201684_017022 [Aphanomyces euteiches]KAH9078827.1 hypothetical protein Ae201684P_019897 [Aphanomyces euteiches]